MQEMYKMWVQSLGQKDPLEKEMTTHSSIFFFTPVFLTGEFHGQRGLVSHSQVQFSRSVVSDSMTLWTAARQASLSITNSRSLPKSYSPRGGKRVRQDLVTKTKFENRASKGLLKASVSCRGGCKRPLCRAALRIKGEIMKVPGHRGHASV